VKAYDGTVLLLLDKGGLVEMSSRASTSNAAAAAAKCLSWSAAAAAGPRFRGSTS